MTHLVTKIKTFLKIKKIIIQMVDKYTKAWYHFVTVWDNLTAKVAWLDDDFLFAGKSPNG